MPAPDLARVTDPELLRQLTEGGDPLETLPSLEELLSEDPLAGERLESRGVLKRVPQGPELDRLEDRGPQITPLKSTGFIEALRDRWGGMDGRGPTTSILPKFGEQSLVGGFLRWMTGNTTKQKQKAQSMRQAPNYFIQQHIDVLERMEAAGQENTAEYEKTYQDLEVLFRNRREATKDPEFSLSAIKDAVQRDPGAAAANLFATLVEDPELLATPAGWEWAAGRAAVATAKWGQSAQKIARMGGGTAGSASVGGGIGAVFSLSHQLDKQEEVDAMKLLRETGTAAAMSPVLVGPLVGASKWMRMSRHQIKEVDSDNLNIAHRDIGAAANLLYNPDTRLGSAIQRVSKTITGMGRAVIDVTGGKAVTLLDDWAKKSPMMTRIRRTLEHFEFRYNPGRDFFEGITREVGRFAPKFDNILDRMMTGLKRPNQRLTQELNDELLDAIRGVKGEYSAPVRQAAEEVRQLLDDLYDWGVARGLWKRGKDGESRGKGYVRNYFTRIYMRKKLGKDIEGREFSKVLMRHGFTQDEADEILFRIVENDGQLYMPGNLTRDANGKITGRKDPHVDLMRRLQKIPDQELAPWLESDFYHIIHGHIQNVVRRGEWVQRYGKQGRKLARMLKVAEAEGRAAGMTREQLSPLVDRVVNLANAQARAYGRIKHPGRRKFNTALLTYQYMRTLPFATLASATEPFIVFLRGNYGSGFKAVAPTLAALGRNTVRWLSGKMRVPIKMEKGEAVRFAEEIGIALDHALADRLAMTFGGEINQLSTMFFKTIGLEQFTRYNRVFSAMAAKNFMEGHLKYLLKKPHGRKAGKYIQELEELGINVKMGKDWMRRGGRVDDPFFDQIKTGAVRFTNEVVMAPRATVKPMWASNPHAAFLFQLKGFQVTFGNTVVKRIWEEAKRGGVLDKTLYGGKLAATVAMMMITAMQMNAVRKFLKFGADAEKYERDPREEVLLALDRTGLLGAGQFVEDAMKSYRYGGSAVEFVAGPTLTQVGGMADAMGKGVFDGNWKQMQRELWRAVPVVGPMRTVGEMAGALEDED